MTTDVKMDYDEVERMASLFRSASLELQDLSDEVGRWVAELEGGVLIGEAGEAFAGALREILSPRLGTLAAKLDENAADVSAAVAYARDGVASARSHFA
jgi:uncharacterized protein YukE